MRCVGVAPDGHPVMFPCPLEITLRREILRGSLHPAGSRPYSVSLISGIPRRLTNICRIRQSSRINRNREKSEHANRQKRKRQRGKLARTSLPALDWQLDYPIGGDRKNNRRDNDHEGRGDRYVTLLAANDEKWPVPEIKRIRNSPNAYSDRITKSKPSYARMRPKGNDYSSTNYRNKSPPSWERICL